MDLISRKYLLIEKIMEVVNPEKIKQVEELLNKAEDRVEEEIVAYTFQGEALTRAQYIRNNEEAMKSVEKGNYSTHQEIIDKFRKLDEI